MAKTLNRNENRNEITAKLIEQDIPFRADLTTAELVKLLENGKPETGESGNSAGLTPEDVEKIKNIVTGLIEPLNEKIEELEKLIEPLQEAINENTSSINKQDQLVQKTVNDVVAIQKQLKK